MNVTGPVFSESDTGTTTAVTPTPIEPGTDVATPTYLALTKSDLDALISKSVAEGMAMARSGQSVVMAAAPEPIEQWTLADLLRNIVRQIRWHDERQVRAAFNAVDVAYPEPSEDK